MQLVGLLLACGAGSQPGWIHPTCLNLQGSRSWSTLAAPWFLDPDLAPSIGGDCSFQGPGQVPGQSEILAGSLPGSQCTGVRFWPTTPFPEAGVYDFECTSGQSFDWAVQVDDSPPADVGQLESVEVSDAEEAAAVVVTLVGMEEDAVPLGALVRVATPEGTAFAPSTMFVLGQAADCASESVLTVEVEGTTGAQVGAAAVPIPCR